MELEEKQLSLLMVPAKEIEFFPTKKFHHCMSQLIFSKASGVVKILYYREGKIHT